MRRVTDAIRRWRGRIAFPGRLRVFADAAWAPALADSVPEGLDWPQAAGDTLLAAACGAAWAERERGGAVLMAAGPQILGGGCSHEALALAVRLGLRNLHWVGADPAAAAIAIAHGWRAEGDQDEAWFVGDAPAVVALRGQAPAAGTTKPAPLRREWQPVHLASLGEAAATQSRATPAVVVRAWIDDLAKQEPRLFLPHAQPPWSDTPDTLAKLIACAHLASDGFRVAWMPGVGAVGPAWLGALHDIGRRGLALKLLLPSADCPSLSHWQAMPEWWLAAPADAADAVGVVAAALDNEDCVAVALPEVGVPFAVDAGFEWGAARWSRGATPAAVVVCDQRSLAGAITARELLRAASLDIDILLCTSLSPLPLSQLAQAATRAPLLVLDGEATQGFSRAVAAALAGQPHGYLAALAGENGAPLPEEIAQAVRAMGSGGAG